MSSAEEFELKVVGGVDGTRTRGLRRDRPAPTTAERSRPGITLRLEAGVNPPAIQKLAGWTSLRMLERYGQVRDAELQRPFVLVLRDPLDQLGRELDLDVLLPSASRRLPPS